jgi:predicted nucleic-acid-binding protein
VRGVDTKLLVRYVTGDHPRQSEVARELFEGTEDAGGRLFLNVVVLCELGWVLGGRQYGFDRRSIAGVLEGILDARVFEIERRDLVRQAVDQYRRGDADLSDLLIGAINRAEGCRETVTLDQRLAGVSGFAPLRIEDP